MITKANLDKRICDVEEDATNTETYREFIRNTEKYMVMCPEPIDNYSDEELEDYLYELDGYWST